MTISSLKAGLWAPAIILCSSLSASGLAAEYSVEANYLLKAEGYTVKIRTRVEYPTLKDKKGSFTGAGFLINKEKGWIATNAHVSSRNPESIEIAFKDRRFVEAKLQFIDRYLDLAVLKVATKHIPKQTNQAELHCGSFPEIGSKVGAYGHPMSLDFSVTNGIVSGLRYKSNRYWVQTDAAINSGNSGGPLIDVKTGKVIGINTAGYSKRKTEGLGFAVPMLYACRVFELMADGKNADVPYVPVAFATSDEIKNKLIVATSFSGLPVEWGLLPEDELLHLSTEPAFKLRNQSDLIHALRGMSGAVELTVLRKGKRKSISIPTRTRPRMTDWVGLYFSGMVLGSELLRDQRLSNPGNQITILDVASASIGSVLGIEAYDYLATADGRKFTDVRKLCAYLEEASDQKKKVRMVTRSNDWDYMAASRYKLFDVRIKDLKLVGPSITDDEGC